MLTEIEIMSLIKPDFAVKHYFLLPKNKKITSKTRLCCTSPPPAPPPSESVRYYLNGPKSSRR